MTGAQTRALGISGLAALVLTFLFFQQMPVDSRQHQLFTHDLLELKQLDAEINRDLLKSRYELLRSYDPFVRNFRQLRKVASSLEHVPLFITGEKRRRILQAAKHQSDLVLEKESLAERFKSENAILRNSFRYFPSLISEATEAAIQAHDEPCKTILANLLRDTLLYDITSRPELAASIRQEVDLFAKDKPRHTRWKTTSNNVAAHADRILIGRSRVQAITEKLISVSISQGANQIAGYYATEFDRASNIHALYRFLMYLCSVFLLGYGVDRTLHLVKSRTALERINGQLHSVNTSMRQAKIDLQAKNEAIESALELLVSAQERYELAAKGANDGLWDWDLTSNEIYYSPRWKKMLGFSPDELANSPATWIDRLHPDDRKRVQLEWRDHFAGHTPVFESEHRMLHDDGTFHWMLSRGMAVRGLDGQPQRMAGSQTDITGNKSKDILTGLANRLLFNERISRIIGEIKRGRSSNYAVIFIDVDRFKVINDSLGHLSGDNLLKQIAERLTKSVRAADSVCRCFEDATVARFGGDEFAILLEQCGSLAAAEKVTDRILASFANPFNVGGREIMSTLSLGVALGTGYYTSPDEILRDADIAMYEAKSSGRARVGFFDPPMRVRAMERMELEADIRLGIEEGQFEVFYQPKVKIKTGRVTGFEALIRWNHPTRGLVLPDEFISIAEETGLIVPLGYWVLNKACLQLKAWHETSSIENLSMSVNISARHLGEPDLVNRVSAIISETGVKASALDLELTESAVMQNPESARTTLEELKSIGIGLDMDDFGTGYSSLSYLQRFPFDSIKIDRSFVSGLGSQPQNRDLIKTIVDLAKSLKMRVIAEGVETRLQSAELMALGCNLGQGYLFSKPISGAAATQIVMKQNSAHSHIAA